MKPLLIIAIVYASFVLGANMPVSHAARATQSTDNNSDTPMPTCTASVPAKWGPLKGVSAVYGIGFEDPSGTLRFVNKFPCGFDTTPTISLELHRK